MWLADNFAPMWIVWFIALAVIGITIGAFIHLHKRGNSFRQTAGTNVFTVVGAIAFVTSLLVYLGFSSPTLVDWWQGLAAAVVWHMGGTLLLEIGIVLDARYGGTLGDRNVHILMTVLLLIGLAMSWSSARDLIAGPVVMHGTANLEVEKWHRNRGGGGISANIDLIAPDGSKETIDLAGWGANRAEDQFGQCAPGSEVDVTVLRHVGTILDVACKER
jgi:hypothetical protein